MRICASWPGPPWSRTCTPGMKRTISLRFKASRAWISFASTMETAFDASCAACGRPDAVTTTASSMPATLSVTSWVAGACAATVTSVALRRNPAFSTSSANTPAGSGSKRYSPSGPVTVRRAAEPSSRAARTLAPTTMAPCGSMTRPRSEEICANAGVASHPATNSAIGIAFRKDAEPVPRRLDARRIWPFSVCVLRTCVPRKGGGQAAERAVSVEAEEAIPGSSTGFLFSAESQPT